MIEAAMSVDARMLDEPAGAVRSVVAMPKSPAAIVPSDTIAGRALIAVIAIMTFLGALTIGAVVLVRSATGEWQSTVAREVTIQIRPGDGRDVEAEVRKAADIAGRLPGVSGVKPFSKEESSRLLEPWLGTGLSLDDLPVPRLIVVRIAGAPVP